MPSRSLRAQVCLQSSGHLRMEAACLQDAKCWASGASAPALASGVLAPTGASALLRRLWPLVAAGACPAQILPFAPSCWLGVSTCWPSVLRSEPTTHPAPALMSSSRGDVLRRLASQIAALADHEETADGHQPRAGTSRGAAEHTMHDRSFDVATFARLCPRRLVRALCHRLPLPEKAPRRSLVSQPRGSVVRDLGVPVGVAWPS